MWELLCAQVVPTKSHSQERGLLIMHTAERTKTCLRTHGRTYGQSGARG